MENESKGPVLVLYTLLGLACLGVTVFALINGDYTLMGVGGVGTALIIALCPIALALTSSATGVSAASGDTFQSGNLNTGGNKNVTELLKEISDHLLISDTAKRIAFREKDREALREAIRNDINKGEFEGALAMVEDMSQTYGYREEAEEFREEIHQARDEQVKSKVAVAIEELDRMIVEMRWAEAIREASKLQRVYSEMEETRGLLAKVREARDGHKYELINEFKAACERDDVDASWELLKEIDQNLTPEEAAPLANLAKDTINKKRENLMVMFRMAVQEQEWRSAVDSGETIIREFPNTKAAEEVKTKLDTLRIKAREAAG